MKKIIFYTFFGLLIFTTLAFGVHKFYMAIYQVNYAPEKKMLQITSRIFIDDLNKTLEKKYNKKLNLGTNKETAEEIVLVKKYLAQNFIIKVNGQTKPITFLSKELDGDVLVCYSNITGISKITSLEISNSILLDWNTEQQNITHVKVLETKNSILFTDSFRNGLLKY